MAVGKTPLSVEDILAKQKAEKEEASKPKFLTKAQRAQIALEKRQQEIAASQDKQAAERAERDQLEHAVEEERRRNESMRYGGGGGGVGGGGYGGSQHGRYGQQSYQPGNRGPPPQNQRSFDRGPQAGPRGPRGAGGPPPAGPRAGGYVSSPLSGGPGRNGEPSQGQSGSIPTGPRNGSHSIGGAPSQDDVTVTASPSRTFDSITDGMPSINSSAAPPTDAELAIIRRRYLGAAPATESGPAAKKPRARKLQDKKFVFDWDASEDTSSAEVGTWRHDIANGGRPVGVGVGTMFGGRLAGYDEGGRRKGTSKALEDNHADTFERRRAAKFGHDDRHWTDKPLTDMRDRDWRIFREDFSISARGGNIPHPMRSWRESGIPESILNIIDEIGYKEPSPIQRQAIPIGLKNRDLIGIAQTGSGKTAAFVIPMLEYISHLAPLDEDNKHLGPYALIMAPTRELAQQIESETKRFAGPMGYKTVSIVGGKAVEEQQFNLRDGAEIVIATPGRLKDIIDRNIMVLSQCRYVVMDEADRMVDLGFEQDLTFILNSMPADYAKPEDMDIDDDYVDPNPDIDRNGPKTGFKGLRVTTLFSATMPPIVERLARQYLRKPATVIIGNAGEAVETVEQRVEFVQGDEKRKLKLQEILRTIGLPPPMIVFVNQKKTADMVVKYVQQAGRRGVTLHSGKNQEQREAALQSLRDGEVEVLVATDLAGRGIDVPDVTCVINWQMASTIEKYVHRIGRTGRAGKTGVAITFLGNEDEETMYDLKQEITKSPISTLSNDLAHHPAARQRITREMKRKRDDED